MFRETGTHLRVRPRTPAVAERSKVVQLPGSFAGAQTAIQPHMM